MPVVPFLLSRGTALSSPLSSLGWDEFFATSFEAFATSHHAARVARVDRGAVDALTEDGPVRARTRPQDPLPAVGDWAALTDDAVGYVVDALLPRRTAVQRASATGRSEAQVLAANVDIAFVVVPAVPHPRPGMAERLVALAWDSGAQPVVVVTKADLTPEAAAVAADLAEATPGVDVVTVDATTSGGAASVMPYLAHGATACLLGRSGAGKSTLANALLSQERFATGAIRADGKGRHTTTHRELVPLPGGGVLVDTPGLRGVGVWLSEEGMDRAYADVEELVEQCRFSDCAHRTEPGCAVLAAVDDGRLPERRFESWRKLQREARWIASRTDARLRAEQRQAWKIVHAEVRRSGRIRP